MKIKKFKKVQGNRYQVTFDDQIVILFDEIILKYNLLTSDDITEKKLKEIIADNEQARAYYLAVKYIDIRLRTSTEVKRYLQKNGFDSNLISQTLNRLNVEGYFNNHLYISSYINDQKNLSPNGPFKILSNLVKLGFEEIEILKYLDFSDENWILKIEKIINKKINSIHNKSKLFIQQKLLNDLIFLGYDKEMISGLLEKTEINDQDNFIRSANKTYNQLIKKYDENKLGYYFRQKMAAQGYDQELINDYLSKI